MMLLRVLCRVSVSVGKCFLKINQQFSLCWLDNKWLNSPDVYPAAISAHGWDYRLDFTKKLINAIAYSWKPAIAVSYWQEIFTFSCEFLASETKTLRIDCFKSCPPGTTHLAKRVLSSALEQRVDSSTIGTIAYAFALQTDKSLLPN